VLDGDRFIYEQLGNHLAAEPAVYTAYLETATSGTVVGGLQRKAYWAALTATRLHLIEARVGAFKPLLENNGLRVIERATIAGVLARGTSLTIALAGGERLAFVAKRKPQHAAGQTQFIDELALRHGGGEVAAEMGSHARLKTIGGVVLGLAVAGYYGYQQLYGGRAEVAVNCDPGQDAITCRATHTSGGATAEACWDLRLGCANGGKSIAHACATVARGGTTEVVLTEAEFSNLEACDEVVSSELKNLEVEID
jgi:hypothetical protein